MVFHGLRSVTYLDEPGVHPGRAAFGASRMGYDEPHGRTIHAAAGRLDRSADARRRADALQDRGRTAAGDDCKELSDWAKIHESMAKAKAWATIAHADTSARKGGDCINVAPGTYAKFNDDLSYGGSAASSTGFGRCRTAANRSSTERWCCSAAA